jgi:hypothetical protein
MSLHFRYCLIIRPTLKKTHRKTRLASIKRAALIWFMSLIYQLLVTLVDYLPITYTTAKSLVLVLSVLQAMIIFVLPLCIIVISYYKTYNLLVHLPVSSNILASNSTYNNGNAEMATTNLLINVDNIPIRAFNRSRQSFARHQSAKKVILYAIIFPVFWLPYHLSFIIRMALYPELSDEIVYFSHFSFLFANLNFIFCPLLLCIICRNSWV